MLSDTRRHLSDNPNSSSYSDGSAENVFAAAYIVPEYQSLSGYNQNFVPYEINVEDNEVPNFEHILQGSTFQEANDFWVAYFVVGYQGRKSQDYDGRISGILEPAQQGVTAVVDTCDCIGSFSCPQGRIVCSSVPIGGNVSLIYLESTQDSDRDNVGQSYTVRDTSIVAPHELGHQFGLRGDLNGSVFSLMDYPNTGISNASRVQLHPEHVNIIRTRVKSPGR
ncbi:MAG: hypothetical protein ABL999_07145 [Pyrinomonadaceae bacterium]